MTQSIGKAYLIGAGPGDPGLLTLRGRQRLAEAQVVLYDYLVNPQIIKWVSAEAETVCLGRHGLGRMISQQEIHDRMIAAARAGKVVARLKGGDPAIFGRAAEEISALESAGIPYEVVPGVSAAQAASSYTGIPLTHRDAASCVAFITGQQCRDREGVSLDMAALACFPGTLAFYMGVTTTPDWATALMAAGKPGETPAAIIRHASLPHQQTVVTTLAQLPDVVVATKLRPPAIIIVGEAVASRSSEQWFAARPLFGRTVMVTRPIDQANSLVDGLSDKGAAILVQPAIEIEPPADWSPVDAAIAELPSWDWLVFSSSNGVESFLGRLRSLGFDMRALGHAKLAAVGPGTAKALSAYHLVADLVPREHRAESLVQALLPHVPGKRVLLLRASRGRDVLADDLAAAGAEVRQVVVYENRDVAAADPENEKALQQGQIDWVTVSSSAIARSLVKLFGEQLRKSKLAAISPLTAGALIDAGYPVDAVASTYTIEGLIDAILEAESRLSRDKY